MLDDIKNINPKSLEIIIKNLKIFLNIELFLNKDNAADKFIFADKISDTKKLISKFQVLNKTRKLVDYEIDSQNNLRINSIDHEELKDLFKRISSQNSDYIYNLERLDVTYFNYDDRSMSYKYRQEQRKLYDLLHNLNKLNSAEDFEITIDNVIDVQNNIVRTSFKVPYPHICFRYQDTKILNFYHKLKKNVEDIEASIYEDPHFNLNIMNGEENELTDTEDEEIINGREIFKLKVQKLRNCVYELDEIKADVLSIAKQKLTDLLGIETKFLVDIDTCVKFRVQDFELNNLAQIIKVRQKYISPIYKIENMR